MRKAVLLAICTVAPLIHATPDYTIRTVAGGGNGETPAASASLVQAEGIAIDGAGNVYVADAGDNRIRKIKPEGIIKTIAGTGSAAFSGDGGPATAAALNHPYGIALDLNGNIYVADLGNARVRRIDANGVITTVAGGGTTSIAGDGIQATNAQLKSPRNVAVDNLGNLYISDFDAQQVYQVSPAGILTVFAGTGQGGFDGDGGAATAARLSFPAGLATDTQGNVFIADSGNDLVRRVWFGTITTVATTVPAPTGLAVDASGRLYVSSAKAQMGATAASPAGMTIELVAAEDVASDAGGTLYLATKNYVRKLQGAMLTTIAGVADPSSGGNDSRTAPPRLAEPFAMTLDSAGSLYVADRTANRIDKVATDGTITPVLNDSTQIHSPSGVAIDSAGNIYFSDTGNNRVQRIGAGGIVSTVIDRLSSPSCLRSTPDGALYICDSGNDRIVRVNPSGVTSIAAKVGKPAGLAIAGDGTLYVSSESQVVKVAADGMIDAVLDQLSDPAGLALASDGRLLVAEAGKHRIIQLGAAGVVTIIAGTGQAGDTGDGGAAAAAQLNSPADIAIDGTGNIFIADAGNNSIRELTIAVIAPPPIVTPPPVITPPPGDTPSGNAPPIVVANAASNLVGAVAPGEIVTIYGSNFDDANNQVTFDDAEAQILYASPGQLNVLTPPGIKTNATTTVKVLVGGVVVGGAIVNTAVSSPAIFTVGVGTGQAAALNQDGSVNSAENPASRGSVICLFLTGDGQNGAPASATIDGYRAQVFYSGPAPGLAGMMQVNVVIPGGFLTPGTNQVIVTINGISTQAGVTIATF